MTSDQDSASTFDTAAYGGQNWSPRSASHREELGTIWRACGIDSEWRRLESVLLHAPGAELAAAGDDPDAVQMLAPLDPGRARAEHDALAEAFRGARVEVCYVDPGQPCQPNLMFCADLFAMTPHGS